MSAATFIVAGALDQPTGGYVYDRAIIEGLRSQGFEIEVVELAGQFPLVDDTARTALDHALANSPAHMPIVIDGLAAGGAPEVVERHAATRPIVVLLHHPLADETGLDAASAARLLESERRVLACARHIVVTSLFTARRLAVLGLARSADVTVIEPGVRTAQPSRPTSGSPCRLLCVASLIPRKDHLMLVEALARLAELDWVCDFVGDDQRDPAQAQAIRAAIDRHGLTDRIRLRGSQPRAAIDDFYAGADLFVLASRYEGYGMVIDEAVAHGLPIVTTTGGALADTLPVGAGIAVAPGQSEAMAEALRTLITDTQQRACAAAGARAARARQRDWNAAARAFAAVLSA